MNCIYCGKPKNTTWTDRPICQDCSDILIDKGQ